MNAHAEYGAALRPGQRQAEAEDIFFGQVVLVLARWFLLAAIMILALTATQDAGETSSVTLLVVGLMALNFYIHARYVLERPANRRLLIAAALLDLLLVTGFVAWWAWDGRRGLDSEFFIFYYPLLFAFALVFPPRLALRYTLLAVGLYLAACLLQLLWSGNFGSALADVTTFKTLLARLVTLGAMSGLGTFYWRIQRERRRPPGTVRKEGPPPWGG